MAAEIEAGGLLLHGHQLHGAVLLHLGYGHGGGGGLGLLAHAEEVQLTGDVVPHGLGDTVQHRPGYLDKGLALVAQAVKGSRLDEVLHGPAVQLPAVHPAAEVVKALERPVLPPVRHQGLDGPPAYALYGHQAEADVAGGDGEVGVGLVHVRGQQLDAHIPALGDVLGHLLAVVQHGGEQGRHVLPGVVALHVGGAVGHDGVAHGVGLVEGVAGEIQYLVVDAVGHRLTHPIGQGSGDVPLRVAVDEGHSLRIDDLVFLLAHGPAYHVRLAQGEARQAAEYLDDLLLVDYAAVGDGEYGPEQLVLVAYLLRVGGAVQKAGYAVHGAGAVEGDDSGDILDAPGLEGDADSRHAGALQLEHAAGAPGGEHVEGLGVLLAHVFYAEIRLPAAHQLHRVLQHRQVPQAQKIHFQKPQLLQGGHGVLADHGLVVGGQRHVLVNRLFGDDHAGGVGGGVAGHALQGLGHVDETLKFFVPLVHLPQGLGQLQGLVQGDVKSPRAGGYLLGHLVGLAVADVQRPGHVPHGAPGGHGAEGDYLGHMVVAVEAVDVVDDLAPAVDAEVHVYIRHGHPLRVEKAFKEKAVLYGVHVGDVQAVAHHAAGGAAPAGAHGYAAALGKAYKVGDYEEIVHEAHLFYHVQLVVQLLVDLGSGGETLPEALLAELAQVLVAVRLPFRQLEAG